MKPKVFIAVADENWICDRLSQEWKDNFHTVDNPHDADIIWILSPYVWRILPISLLKSKTVCLTVHHITPWKFTREKLREFLIRDSYINFYHVPCNKTKEAVKKITKKDVFVQPFWVNNNIWFSLTKPEARSALDLPNDEYLIGSFQRDTEGGDLKSPKLEKGPDIFCDIVESISGKNDNLAIVLAGLRRQYVIERLKKAGIKYYYYEQTDFQTLNKLYNSLDLYIVSSRCEGGPQAIVEAAATKTPIISTDVGLATYFLSSESIYDPSGALGKPNVKHAYSRVKEHLLPTGFEPFVQFFESVV